MALINQRTVDKLGIKKERYKKARVIENFTGETVNGAGHYYTEAMRLQHRKHFSKEVF